MSSESQPDERVDNGLPLSRSAGWIVVYRSMVLQREELRRTADEPDDVDDALSAARQQMMWAVKPRGGVREQDAPQPSKMMPEHEVLFHAALRLTANNHQDEMTCSEAADVLKSNFLLLEAIEFEPNEV